MSTAILEHFSGLKKWNNYLTFVLKKGKRKKILISSIVRMTWQSSKTCHCTCNFQRDGVFLKAHYFTCYSCLLHMPERVFKIVKIVLKHRQPMVNSWKELKLLGAIVNYCGVVGWRVEIRILAISWLVLCLKNALEWKVWSGSSRVGRLSVVFFARHFTLTVPLFT